MNTFAEAEFDRLTKAEKLSYIVAEKGYALSTLRTVLSDYFVTPGIGICRGDFPTDYSILVQFAIDDSQVRFNFINITNNFALTLDLCSKQISVFFMAPGCQSKIHFPLPRNAKFGKDHYHKIGLKVTDDSIKVEFDCEPVGTMAKASCPVLCGEEVDVHILQPLPTGCRADYDEVRKFIEGLLMIIMLCH